MSYSCHCQTHPMFPIWLSSHSELNNSSSISKLFQVAWSSSKLLNSQVQNPIFHSFSHRKNFWPLISSAPYIFFGCVNLWCRCPKYKKCCYSNYSVNEKQTDMLTHWNIRLVDHRWFRPAMVWNIVFFRVTPKCIQIALQRAERSEPQNMHAPPKRMKRAVGTGIVEWQGPTTYFHYDRGPTAKLIENSFNKIIVGDIWLEAGMRHFRETPAWLRVCNVCVRWKMIFRETLPQHYSNGGIITEVVQKRGRLG